MKVFKFGGASLKNATAFGNIASIIKRNHSDRLIIVVSAIGKTTNQLEKLLEKARNREDFTDSLSEIQKNHESIARELFGKDGIAEELEIFFKEIVKQAQAPGAFDQVYDQVVSFGELLSSFLVLRYLKAQGFSVRLVDARSYINTNDCFREGKVEWTQTEKKIQQLVAESQESILLTQGFIGSTGNGLTTTLGREGSDYTAAIFGFCTRAHSVTIWKDVPGVMSADPKRLPAAVVFNELPYQEAAEMTYYGASVIHPKTIKPLANKGIPLYVKSFADDVLPGTVIHQCHVDSLPPLIIFKENQCLISCKVTDFSFINEQQLSIIFKFISEHDIKINLMQNSAISFSFCLDFRESKVMKLIESLSQHFEVYYNTGLTLITVKNYDTITFNEYRSRKGVLLEQSSRSTLQVLVKD